MWNLIKGEPVLFQGVIQAALALTITFGGSISATQVGSILALSAAILSWITRRQVSPVGNPKALNGTPHVADA
jgi:hypothetical protein